MPLDCSSCALIASVHLQIDWSHNMKWNRWLSLCILFKLFQLVVVADAIVVVVIVGAVVLIIPLNSTRTERTNEAHKRSMHTFVSCLLLICMINDTYSKMSCTMRLLILTLSVNKECQTKSTNAYAYILYNTCTVHRIPQITSSKGWW